MKRLFQRSEYFKNATTLIIGVGLAQTIPVLLQPLLRRMYDPEEFGVFAVYFAIVSTFSMIANFRYAHVVVIPKEDEESKSVLAGALILITLFSMIFAVFAWFFGSWCIDQLRFPVELEKWKMLIPVGIFFVSGSLVLNSWLTRKKRFKAIAANKLVRRGSEGVAQLGFGKIKYVGGIILGSFIGDVVNHLVSWFQFIRSGGNFKGISRKSIWAALKRYKEFPLYNLIPTVLDTASLFLPVLVISAYYSKAVTGQFDLSRQILALPLALISAAISQVLLQKLSEHKNSGKPILPLIKKNLVWLALLGVLGILVLAPFAVPLFKFIFGDKWEMAGEMTTVLVFSYALRFAVTPLTVMFVAIEKILVSSLWQIGYFFIMLILISFKDLEVMDFIFYFVIIEVVSYALYLLLVIWTANRHDKRVAQDI